MVLDQAILSVGHNERVQSDDPIAHGEMACLRNAGRIKSYRDCVLYTTLAPCAMCAGAIVQFGIRQVIVGENQTFPGEIAWLQSRGVEVTVVNSSVCVSLMQEFMTNYPNIWAEDIGQS